MQTILGKESNGYDDYNYYNPGLRSYLATGGFTPYGALTKPLSQYTIGEIQAFQKAPESPSPGRLHATGRYQIIPTTLTGILSSAGLTASDMYNAENQDKLGMALLSSRTLKYLNKELPDTVENLENAALDIAKTWSSVGVPYDMKGAFINVKKNEGYYKKQGTAVDSGGTKTEDVQAALKYERNKSGSQPAASNNTTAGFSTVVIGDSLYYSIRAANSKIQLITTPQMAQASKHLDSDRADGSGGKSLLTLLKEAKVFTDVKNVIVTIGANDLWTLNTAKQNEAIGLIKSKFPNAKYYIMNGNYGWGGLKVEGANTDAVWISKINNYVNVFKQGGFEVIGQVTKVLVHPAPNDTFYKTYETKLKTFV
jgi:hypothetical protein